MKCKRQKQLERESDNETTSSKKPKANQEQVSKVSNQISKLGAAKLDA